MKRKLFDSIVFNYLGAFAAAIGPLLVVPLYVNNLGPSQWGLMSVVFAVVALALMVDGGLGQVFLREFSIRANERGCQSSELQALWSSCRMLYATLALILAAILLLTAPWLTCHWLNLGPEVNTAGATAVMRLSGLLVAAQLFAASPRSLLLALHLYRPLNLSIALAHTFRFGGGAILVIFGRSLGYVLVWYVIVALVEAAARHLIANRAIAFSRGSEADWSEIKQLIPSGAALSLAVILSGLTTQMDKLILSKMVTVDQVGIYAIASSVALGLLSLTYPLIQSAFPTLLSVRTDRTRVRRIFLIWLAVAACASIAAMLLYVGVGKDVLNFWLRDQGIAAAVYPVLLLLLAGTLLNVVYQVGYIGWMLEANYKMPMIVSAVSVLLTLLLAPLLVNRYGIMGAAVGWLSINAVGLLLSLSWFRKIV